MSTKVKGLIKGLKYISQIFDEEKEAEIQIGFPTDVKHVAHIGWDGPSAQDNPSWMKEFKGQSAPLGPPTGDANKENPEIKWVSEDPKSRKSRAAAGAGGDTPELPKSSRRQSSSSSDNPDSPKSSKPRQNRRRHSKDASDLTKSTELGVVVSESSAKDTPNLPKKTRRKKSKESDAIGNASSRRSSRGGSSSSNPAATSESPEPDNAEQCEASSPKSLVKEEEGK